MSKIEDLVRKEFGDTPFTLEDVIKFLENNYTIRWEIFKQVEFNNYKEDVKYCIDEYNEMNDTNYVFSDEEIDCIVRRYDDLLGDYSNWHDILDELVSDWCDDRG